jgi:D-ala D-ala ligase C-terminus
MTTHLIGLLLGTEEDWSSTFEELLARLDLSISHGGETHTFATERVTIEPFRLRAVPRHSLVIDRLAHWYYVPREWLKKVALMDGVYLLNNPFTFQAMEKHAAYCAMMHLGLKVPETWLLPYKNPPADERFAYTASHYNLPFDLEAVAEQIGYPLYMKPYDGGAWVGVTRIENAEELRRAYDASGRRLMHLQGAVDFDVFVRTLSIGAETMVMRFDPARPMFDRYQVDHEFLPPGIGLEVVTISRVVNAFFRWEFNSCETLVRGDEVFPIDYANACPDVSLTSLHYYFPWAIKTLLKWSLFCIVTGRRMQIDMDLSRWFAIADDPRAGYGEKLAAYHRLTDDYFTQDDYEEFCDRHLGHLDEVLLELVEGDWFDAMLERTVRATFPDDEHERFLAHYRGLLRAWVDDRSDLGGRRARAVP